MEWKMPSGIQGVENIQLSGVQGKYKGGWKMKLEYEEAAEP